jgi:hypothetical protein
LAGPVAKTTAAFMPPNALDSESRAPGCRWSVRTATAASMAPAAPMVCPMAAFTSWIDGSRPNGSTDRPQTASSATCSMASL